MSYYRRLSPLHFLCTQGLHHLHLILLLPTPMRLMAHGNLPELCSRLKPVPHIMILVFPTFTLSLCLSMPSFQVNSLRTHSSMESAVMTRSSALRSSHGTPVNSHHLSNKAVGNPLNDFHSLLRHFQSSIVASVQSITLFLVKLCSLSAGTFPSPINKASSTTMKSRGLSTDCYGEVTDHGSTCITCRSDHLIGQPLFRTSSWRWPSSPYQW